MLRLSKIITILFLILFSSLAYADQDLAPDFYCDPGEESGISQAFGGKPISLVSGAETFSRADLTLGTIFPINVQRRYNSRSSYDSPLGYGWAINYDKRIYTYPDNSVTLRKECGWKIRFTWSVANGYTPATGESGTLVQNETDGSFIYTGKNGEKEIYDPQGRLTRIIDTKGNYLELTYTGVAREPLWGILLANVDQTVPRIVSYDYRLSRIEEKNPSGQATGKWATFNYDSGTGRLTDIQDSAGRTFSYGHDSYGNLTSVSGPAGIASYAYNDPNNKHLLTTIDDGKGEYVNQYDTKGRVARQTHGTGVIDFEYITPYQKTKMTTTIADSAGTVLNTQTRTVEFDTNGQPNKVTDTYGNVKIYSRNSNMWLLREEHWENTGTVESPTLVLRTATDYTYDSRGNVETRTEAQGTANEKTTIYTYDPVFNLVSTVTVTSVVNPGQTAVTTNVYNPNGTLQTTTETGLLGDGTLYSYTTTYSYYPNGMLESIDGPRTDLQGVQDITTYEYTAQGYLWKINQPHVGTTVYGGDAGSGFDGLGNPTTIKDPNGAVTNYTYYPDGRIETVTAPGDTRPTRYYYVSGGSCGSSCSGASKIDYILLPEGPGDGNKIDYDYDAYGNLSKISDNARNSINYTYDSEGNKLSEEIRDTGGALQKSLTYQYDALNRLKRINNPDSSYTEYAYDSRGNRTSVKAPARTDTEKTTYLYDALNRLTDVIQPPVAPATSVNTIYGYNSNNNLTSVTDANGNTTTYKYDDKGRVYQVISPDTGTTTYSYDPAGNMVSKNANGVTISYQYDALNRLTTIDFSTDTDIVYAYDNCLNGKGRLCSMTDASGTTTYEYWPKGQVKKETRTIDSVAYVMQYTYDQNGNLKTMTYPSGKVITYNYTNDRVVSVLNGAAYLAGNSNNDITYKPFGGMAAIPYGNGISGSISYDTQYRVTAITAGSVMNLSYPIYDFNGNIKAINDTLDPTKNKSFTYDPLDRLDTATSTGIWGSLDWTYDGVGNRMAENTTNYTYVPDTNKLSTVGGISFGFDSNGNTAAEGARQFVYNQNQRLIRVTDSGVTKGEYTYNGNGQRVKKVTASGTTIFHYSTSGQIIAESNSSGTITAEYVYLNGQPLTKIEGTDTYYYHNDHLGTPQKLTDSTGAVVWAADYKPFGEVNITTNTITNNLRFPGQYFDQETNLHQNWNRDYNFATDTYIEADPMGILGGTNQIFVYARNNPLRFKDPQGLDTAGCDYVPDWAETTCWLECCADHDKCFKEEGCNAKSMFGAKCSNGCDKCNSEVKSCFLKCGFKKKDDPDKPNYYCAKLGKYISLNDHDYKYAKTFCDNGK